MSAQQQRPVAVIGRYALYGKLASGGMATVHFGRLLGPVGFTRTVAIKRLHPQFAKDPEFVAMFMDEARLAARIQHPNVVATVDIVAEREELFIVMDYIRGESFSRLLKVARKKQVPVSLGVIGAVVSGMLHGLHAAHEAKDERGNPLNVVHRDVSPQNVLIGVDGVPRVLDFGVAKAAARVQVTRDGQMKGKLAYMSPEQLQGVGVDRRGDVFAAGVVLWESLTGRRLFTGKDAGTVLRKILTEPVPPPSEINPQLPASFDPVVLKALEKNPDTRYQSAREFAIAVENSMPMASARELGEWVEIVAGDALENREKALAEIESISSISEVSRIGSDSDVLLKTLHGQDVPPSSRMDSSNPPVPRSEPPTVVERSAPGAPVEDDDDAATTIYAGDTTDTAAHRLPADLLARQGRQRRRLLYFGGAGMVAAALTGFVVSTCASRDAKRAKHAAEAAAMQERRQLAAEKARREREEKAADARKVESLDSLPTAEVPEPFVKTGIPVDSDDEEGEPPREKPHSEKKASDKVRPRPPPPTPRVVAPKPEPAPPAPEPTATEPPSPLTDCAQPFYVDKRGIKRIKPKCL